MSNLRGLLQSFFAPFDQLLGALPLGAGKVAVTLLLLLPLLWVLRLDSDFIFLGSPERSRRRDLRIWAVLITVPYLLIYLLL